MIRPSQRHLPEPWDGVILARVVDPAAPTPPARPAARIRATALRVAHGVATLLIIALSVGITTLSGSGGVARADISPCIDDPTYNTWGPENVRSGIDGMITQTGPKGTYDTTTDPLPNNKYPTIEAAIADTTYTDYEKLGTAGAVWSVDYGSQDEDDNACFPIDKVVGNFVANTVFNVSKLLSRVSISTYQWASAPGILDPLNDPLDETVNSMWSGGIKGMVAVLIALGLISVTWMVVKDKRPSRGLGGIAWMIGALVLLMLFVAKPSGVATAADGLVQDMTSFAMSTASSNTENKDPHVKATYDKVRQSDNAGPRIAADMMWRLLVFTPWMAGQYGPTDQTPIMMQTSPAQPPDTPAGWYDGSRDARYQQLYAQACVLDPGLPCEQFDATPSAPEIAPYFAYSQSWYMVQNWTCTSADYCIGPVGNPDGGDDDDDREVADSNGWQYRALWSGDQPNQRMMAAFTAGIASTALGLLIFIFSAMTIAYALVLYILLFLAPFLLLLGIEPRFGRRLVGHIAGFAAATVLKRIGVGLLLTTLIVVFQVIMMSGLGWFGQVGLMIGFAAAALIVRAPMAAALASFAPDAGAFGGSDDSMHEKITERSKQARHVGARHSRRLAAGSLTAPVQQRRAFMASRTARDVARGELDRRRLEGEPISARQQRGILRTATVAGWKAGNKADNRVEAERHGAVQGDRAARTRLDAAQRAEQRKFARTEQGRAQTVANQVRAQTEAARRQQGRLRDRDESVRIAAQVNPKRFRGTPRNFEGYDAEGNPTFVDRNTRRAQPQRRHSARTVASGVPLRGADPLPRADRRRIAQGDPSSPLKREPAPARQPARESTREPARANAPLRPRK